MRLNEEQKTEGADVGTLSITTPDGEILEADTPEELQQKLAEHLESVEAEHGKREDKVREDAAEREKKLEKKFAKELAEIDENLRSHRLTRIEESRHIARREEIMQARGERADAEGSAGRNRPATVAGLKTTEELAKEAGMSVWGYRSTIITPSTTFMSW